MNACEWYYMHYSFVVVILSSRNDEHFMWYSLFKRRLPHTRTQFGLNVAMCNQPASKHYHFDSRSMPLSAAQRQCDAMKVLRKESVSRTYIDIVCSFHTLPLNPHHDDNGTQMYNDNWVVVKKDPCPFAYRQKHGEYRWCGEFEKINHLLLHYYTFISHMSLRLVYVVGCICRMSYVCSSTIEVGF